MMEGTNKNEEKQPQEKQNDDDNDESSVNEEINESETEAQEEQKKLKLEEERKQALELMKEVEEKNKQKIEFRKKNLAALNNRPDESFFRKLDSSLKKNTTFVKKLGKLTEQQRTQFSNEFKGLNLTRYIQEIATNLFHSKIKMCDIPCAVHICSLMHQRYGEFTPMLYQTAKKMFTNYMEDKASMVSNASKVRTDMRFVAELTVANILTAKEGLTLTHNLLVTMTQYDRERHELLTIITSVCKHNGEDLAGLVPRKYKSIHSKFNIEIPKSTVFPPDKQKHFYSVLCTYWSSVKDHLMSLHKGLQAVERRNQSILQSKGELHDEKSKEYTDKHAVFSKLQFNAIALADLLDVEVPEFHDHEASQADVEATAAGRGPNSTCGEGLTEGSMWEDDDQKSFYTNIQDLRSIIPAILFKDTGKHAKKVGRQQKQTNYRKKVGSHHSVERKPIGPKPVGKAEIAAEVLGKDIANLEIPEVDKSELPLPAAEVKAAAEAAAVAAAAAALANEEAEESPSVDDVEDDATSLEDDTEEEDVVAGGKQKKPFDKFISDLKNCVNRDLVDKVFFEFYFLTIFSSLS